MRLRGRAHCQLHTRASAAAIHVSAHEAAPPKGWASGLAGQGRSLRAHGCLVASVRRAQAQRPVCLEGVWLGVRAGPSEAAALHPRRRSRRAGRLGGLQRVGGERPRGDRQSPLGRRAGSGRRVCRALPGPACALRQRGEAQLGVGALWHAAGCALNVARWPWWPEARSVRVVDRSVHTKAALARFAMVSNDSLPGALHANALRLGTMSSASRSTCSSWGGGGWHGQLEGAIAGDAEYL